MFDFAQFAGTALVVLAVVAIAASMIALAWRLLAPQSRGTSFMDDYMASGVGNHNPPHIPATYSSEVRYRTSGKYVAGVPVMTLDDPDTQHAKFEAGQQTNNDLRNKP